MILKKHKMSSRISINIEAGSALFLDRDGVINQRIIGDYVRNVDQFEILTGVLDTISECRNHFTKIFVVTNQQGIGKGLMTVEDLHAIHEHFLEAVRTFGGNIDEFYFAPQLADEDSSFRKPNIGMAAQAQSEFPEIDLSSSFMIGDSMSDMEFGYNAGMTTFYISDKPIDSDWINYNITCLADFLEFLPN